MPGAPDLAIRRLVLAGQLVGGRGEAEVRAAASDLARQLDAALGGVGAGGYWVVRRVDVTAQVAAGWTAERMATAVAREVVGRLGEALATPDGDAVAWYPDRAAHMAEFLVDLTHGRARGRWQYGRLLAGLDRDDGALAALAGREPGLVAEALAGMRPADLARVARACADPAGVLVALAGVPTPPRPGPVLDVLPELRAAGLVDPTAAGALVLAVTAARRAGVALAGVAGPAGAAARATALPDAPWARAAVRDADWSALLAEGCDPAAFLGLVSWSGSARERLAEALVHRTPDPATRRSPFGGALVLLAVLEDLWSWSAATAGWPDPGGAAASRLAQLVALTAGMGGGRHAAVLADPVIREVLEVPDGLGPTAIAAWAVDLRPEHVATFEAVAGRRLVDVGDPDPDLVLAVPGAGRPGARLLARAAAAGLDDLGRRLPGMAGSSPGYLVANLLEQDVWTSRDGGSGTCRLGGAPLSVLLAMTGLDRSTLHIGRTRWSLSTRA